ncbi:MAG: hypothetical protein ABIS50_17785 [Luteolibacter sp.]|uniref:hypothetical protein n=1 Tax=Luteolibacter sp. TaxID=1962973 RepID=UPI0032668C7D
MTSSKVFITSAFLASGVTPLQAATTWIANLDFVANEKPDLPNPLSTELSDPNGKVPEWSYGYRDVIASTTLTLFATSDHNNAIGGNPDFQGWQNSFLTTAANTSGIVSGGLNPYDLLVHPMADSSSFTYNVIRWTAPSTGVYDISSSWYAASTLTGPGLDGVDCHIVLNGTSLFDALVAPGQTVVDFGAVNLIAGDFVDFVLGPGNSGDSTSDSTIFNTTITLVPETSSTLLIAAAAPILFRRRRKISNPPA